MAPVEANPALDLDVVLFNGLDAFVEGAVSVCDLILHEADLFGEVLGAVNPVVEDHGGILRLDRRRHLLDEVYREIVSRHGC